MILSSQKAPDAEVRRDRDAAYSIASEEGRSARDLHDGAEQKVPLGEATRSGRGWRSWGKVRAWAVREGARA